MRQFRIQSSKTNKQKQMVEENQTTPKQQNNL